MIAADRWRDGAATSIASASPAARAFGDYTPRLLPRHPTASIPLEAQVILWQQ